MQFLRRGITSRPGKDLKVRSSLVRRLVQGQHCHSERIPEAGLMTDSIERTLHRLAGQLPGRVSRPGDNRCIAATALWAKPIGRMPRAVVHCRTAQDVQLDMAAA